MEDKDKAIYEEMKENLVDINMQRQRILETRKKLNKRMRTLEKSAKNVNIEIVNLKRKYKDIIMNNNVAKVIKETELDIIEAEKVIKETDELLQRTERLLERVNNQESI